MNKEMIISSSGYETMAAILENDEVVEISVERDKSRGVVGNIYQAMIKILFHGRSPSTPTHCLPPTRSG